MDDQTSSMDEVVVNALAGFVANVLYGKMVFDFVMAR
jgi:hypothetical protein